MLPRALSPATCTVQFTPECTKRHQSMLQHHLHRIISCLTPVRATAAARKSVQTLQDQTEGKNLLRLKGSE
jgi:hypothetical protein